METTSSSSKGVVVGIPTHRPSGIQKMNSRLGYETREQGRSQKLGIDERGSCGMLRFHSDPYGPLPRFSLKHKDKKRTFDEYDSQQQEHTKALFDRH